MGRPLVQQINHPHHAADKSCEGCHGSGWLTALVDSEDVLRDARRRKPCDFVMACGECEVFKSDDDAIEAASKAGLNVSRFGVVKYRKSDFAADRKTLVQFMQESEYAVLFWTSNGTPMGEHVPLGYPDIDFAERNDLLDLVGEVKDEIWSWNGEGNVTDDRRNSLRKIDAFCNEKKWNNLVAAYEAGD